ncbi:MAG: type II/IV secretion system protein [Arcobacter butzleri]|nr:GspE/PulE family protein [Arcobacteraceae bacterium]MDY0364938.1 GspE/PulE family protein [Arcobacteraceae bacterium]NLO17607.1 type II/IV secretion system protein [Aliarcobacter butzleri]
MKNYLIDYRVLDEFDIEFLQKTKILPIVKNELYITCMICKESDISSFKDRYKVAIKTIDLNQEKILFELQNITIKQELFILSKLLIEGFTQQTIKDFIYKIVIFAVSKKSSDIHIEEMSEIITIKFRIDGVLIEFFRFDKEISSAISSVLKLFSNLDITQKRLPQNGRFSIELLQEVDFRISFMPTINGESIVIRVLEKNFDRFELEKIGFSSQVLEIIRKNIHLSQGLILVTGPTGSGKTTTLYSILKELKGLNKKIITAEDPIEYKIDNITQISVNNEIGLSYHEILKNILRQDPDILLIGEIRDYEALKSAITASMTGHLVFATLHTNDAISTIFRLLDLEGEHFLIATVLKCVIAQRLLRKRCECMNIKGCIKCNYTGYSGRIVVSEVLQIDKTIEELISNRANHIQIQAQALEKGFITMFDDGMQKVKSNITTKEELLLVLQK